MAHSLPALLRAVEEEAEEHRTADLCLIVRAQSTGATILEAGGRWDFVDKRWLDQDPEHAKFIDIHDGQVPFFRWLARWLPDFRDGYERGTERLVLDRLLLAESGRRAGKTRALQTGIFAVAVDVPWIAGTPLVAWIVSKSHEEEEEIRDNAPAILPSHWYTWHERKHRYQLVHGSYVALISSERPGTTKRGKVDVALVNEAQKQSMRALTNLVYGTADRGGCTWLAANPNDTVTGEWVAHLRQEIQAERLPRTLSFYFDPKLNTFVDQTARADVDAIVRALDPKQADRDGAGQWIPLVDKAYYQWKDAFLRKLPEIGDVTNAFLRQKLGSCTYEFIGAVDFQRTPGICCNIWKLVQNPADPSKPFIHAVDEVLVERGTEYTLSDDLYDRGYSPESLLLIADATGQQQDFEHRQGQDSFSKLRARGWHVEAPQPKRSSKSKNSGNPKVAERLRLVNEELEASRVLVAPDAPITAWALREAILRPGRYGGRVPGGEGWAAHLSDCPGYLLWWLRPPPLPALKSSGSATTTATPPPKRGANWWPR